MILFSQQKSIEDYSRVSNKSQVCIKESPSFASKLERFLKSSSQHTTPGPGSYNIPMKDIQRTSNYRVNKNNHSLVQIEHLWLVENKRFDDPNLSKLRNLGPGAYSPSQSQISTKNLSFSKDKRFGIKKNPTSPRIGPGIYNIDDSLSSSKNKKGIVSSFKSKSNRFQYSLEKGEQTNTDGSIKAKLINQQSELQRRIKRDNQILRNIQLLDALKKSFDKKQAQNKLSYIFKSSKPRFQPMRVQEVGPGSYNTLQALTSQVNQFNQSLKIRKTQVQLKQLNPELDSDSMVKQLPPPPTKYNINHFTIQNSVQKSPKGGYINEETRFKFYDRQTQKIKPGPGSYNKEKFIYIDKDSYARINFDLKTKKLVSHSVPFLSCADRLPSSDNDNLLPFGYESNIYDIQKKVQKSIVHLKKLKMMDVEVPPFNSNAKRII